MHLYSMSIQPAVAQSFVDNIYCIYVRTHIILTYVDKTSHNFAQVRCMTMYYQMVLRVVELALCRESIISKRINEKEDTQPTGSLYDDGDDAVDA